jgi:exonuclease III
MAKLTSWARSGKHLSNVALHVYHQNVQGIPGKIDEVLNFLYSNLIYILCISEHHLDQLELDTVHLGRCTLGAGYCRCSMKQGGVCIYVYQDLSYSKIDVSNFSLDQHIEVSASLSSNYFQTIDIAIIYRAPSGNFSIFFKKKLESILNLYFRNNIKIILCGNINVIICPIITKRGK